MKKTGMLIGVCAVLASPSVWAAPYVFSYNIQTGKKYLTTMTSQSETNFMGNKSISRSKTVIEYRTMRGSKKDWVLLTARIRSLKDESGQDTGQTMGIYQVEYKADMHRSGEIRNIRYSGAKISPEMEEQAKSLPPEMAALVMQSANFVAEQWKESIFWFPEFTQRKLSVGEEFEFTRKAATGMQGMPGQTQFVSKLVFTLEAVSSGLAHFSVEERALTKSSGVMGSTADTKSLGKSKAVFDLRQGIWIEMTSKYRSQVQFSGGPAAGTGSESGNNEVFSIIKYETTVE